MHHFPPDFLEEIDACEYRSRDTSQISLIEYDCALSRRRAIERRRRARRKRRQRTLIARALLAWVVFSAALLFVEYEYLLDGML